MLDTWAAALWCLVRTSSYEECVLAAVNLGEDTDTTAAVAGALAGIAYWGIVHSSFVDERASQGKT